MNSNIGKRLQRPISAKHNKSNSHCRHRQFHNMAIGDCSVESHNNSAINKRTRLNDNRSHKNIMKKSRQMPKSRPPLLLFRRDNFLLFKMNVFQISLFIWLVMINFNVNLVFSDNSFLKQINHSNDGNYDSLANTTVNQDNDSRRKYSTDDNNNNNNFQVINHITTNSNGNISDFNFLNDHNIVSDNDILNDNHFTSTWAVHVPGGELEANRVAADHGFRNLGKVSANFSHFNCYFKFLFSKSKAKCWVIFLFPLKHLAIK